ncbi:hypothetical protein [Pseudomonas syringae]|uniref:hypothetical protein n=1 Tax=Pseudomonas syringae TaxID=317 RepID=UPI000304CACE|nr:hypothetical protein [Pseudomonas syringae]AQL40044.1 hypothetical protein JN853_28950 [Pseudomonas syringae pv. actinidiae ICMP 9853]EPM83606.1 hypothetical protein A260_24040 [Pseudomonas syringae pv. actinidiae ICMP 19068]EPM93818.1 hypothetical protein A258_23323 [Pseudomonas syringae pv. actinidiae ICMP 19104]EPN08334.1 hypothetical protein A252_23170 [Pseudomonas syringae pv. actinidiae ICMP 9855]KCU95254.1 hypothetical protein A250_25131 [Pseudomonas syringae pv. actinidiae ICMP 9617
MAKKPGYIVVDGCIQEGRNVILRGSPYAPASKEMEDALIAEGRIAMSTDPRAQEAIQSQAASPGDTDDATDGD